MRSNVLSYLLWGSVVLGLVSLPTFVRELLHLEQSNSAELSKAELSKTEMLSNTEIQDKDDNINQGVAASSLDIFGKAPEIQLQETNGATFSTAGYKGHIWIINFFFANCEKVCPALNGRLARIYREHASSDRVRFLSITVDPERDTPQALTEYAKRFNARPPVWRFLTGSRDDITSIIADGFKLVTNPDVSLHTTRVVLVDEDGNIRGFYQGTDNEAVTRLATDLDQLLE